MNSNAEYELRICRAIDYINANLADSPSVKEIAAAAPFSPYHFQRLFRAMVGETVAEFTRRIRLETAARRLRAGGGDDITGLAIELGFSSSQNFAKAFKKHFGQSPTQFAASQLATTDVEVAAEMQSAGKVVDHSELDVRVDSLPEQRIAYKRHFGSYNDPGVQRAFDELEAHAVESGFDLEEAFVGIPWDDMEITSEDKCRFDAGILVPTDAFIPRTINQQTIPAGRYAILRIEITGNDFDLPWTRLLRDWLPGSVFQPADGPRFERYLTDGTQNAEGRWQLEVCLPVKPL